MRRYVWIFVLLAMFGMSFAAFSVMVNSNKQIYKPGESGSITLEVANAAEDSKIISASIGVTGSPNFIYTQTVQIGELDSGATTTLTIPITVIQNTPSGVYVFKLRAQGYEIKNDGSNVFAYREASIPVYVLNKPILLINDYSKDYSEGQLFKFKINNYGGSARDVRVSVVAPFAIIGANEIFLGDINSTKNVSMPLDVSDAPEGRETMQMVISYEDELGNEVTETKDVSLTVKKETPDLVISQSAVLLSNSDNVAKFKIINGAKPLKNVKFTFSNQKIIIKGGSNIKVGDLASGESKEVSFIMHPDLSPGTMNDNVLITYTDDEGEKTEPMNVALTIDSNSDVQVYIEAKPVPVLAGQEQTLSVTVANTWDYPIESTSVKINGDFYDLVSVQNDQYIGLLNKDDFSSVQFKVKIKDDAKPENNLTVRVKYKDAFGNFVERQKTLTVRVSEKPAEQGGIPIPFIAGGAIVLVLVYWFFFRKKAPA